MKKIILVFVFLLSQTVAVYSQGKIGITQILEGEIRAGLTTPLGGYHDGKSQISASVGLEGRYNFKGTP